MGSFMHHKLPNRENLGVQLHIALKVYTVSEEDEIRYFQFSKSYYFKIIIVLMAKLLQFPS